MLAIIYYYLYIYITHTMLEQPCLQRPNFFRSIQCWRNSGRCAACFAAFQLSSALGGGKVMSLGGCSKWVLVTSFCWCKQSQREIPKECIHLASLLTRLKQIWQLSNDTTIKKRHISQDLLRAKLFMLILWKGVVAFPRSKTAGSSAESPDEGNKGGGLEVANSFK